MDISDEDLLNDDSFVVPNSVPDAENFTSQLVVCLGIKSQSNTQTKTVTNNTNCFNTNKEALLSVYLLTEVRNLKK